MTAEDESNVTDIDLLPDGRICVFGTSLEVLEVQDQLQCGADGSISERLDALRQTSVGGPRQMPVMVAEESDA